MPESPTDQLLLNVAAFLAGLLLGHWLAIGRERRSAFHGISQKLREELLRGPGFDRIPAVDLDLYLRLASTLERFRMRRAMHRYKQAKREAMRRDGSGGVHHERTPELLLAHAKVLKLTE